MPNIYGSNNEPYEFHVPFGDSKPGDMFPMDADLTIYWPKVRPIWEESYPITISHTKTEIEG